MAPVFAHTGIDYARVTHSGDAGPGSLRAAILHANDDEETRIVFQIPVTDAGFDAKVGVWTLAPRSPLPPIRAKGTVLDGVSQTQILDSNPNGPEIRLSGKNLRRTPGANAPTGILVLAPNCALKNLSFADFAGAALTIRGEESLDNRVENCVFEGSAAPQLLITGGANANQIENNRFFLSGKTGETAIRVAGQGSTHNTLRLNRFFAANKPNGEFSARLRPIWLDSDEIQKPILKITRLEKAGVFHEVSVEFRGAPGRKYTLDMLRANEENFWASYAKIETQTSEIQTDETGRALWKSEVRGYPAGSFAAQITSRQGQSSEISDVWVMPYLR